MPRKVIHIDADCFFAAIEMRDDPRLQGKAMAVGGREDHRGVIATCNYQARSFGIRSAMPSSHARRLCPELIIVPGRMDAYREASKVMRDIFLQYTERVEPLSLDEAFLDVSDCRQCQGSATLMAVEIRQKIEAALSITVSAGVAPNKFLAKVASDWRKPNGLTTIAPSKVEAFVQPLAVERIHGVGKVTAGKLHGMGIKTCADLRLHDVAALTQAFGSFGERLHHLSYGRDPREVIASRRRKSLSVEHTYRADLLCESDCLAETQELLSRLQRRLDKLDDSYRVVKAFVKVKFSDFRSTTLECMVNDLSAFEFNRLFVQALSRSEQPVRLLGLGVRFLECESNSKNFQIPLFV